MTDEFKSEFEGCLYDNEGNEIILKPGHSLVVGKNGYCQVKNEDYEMKLVFDPNIENPHSDRMRKFIEEYPGRNVNIVNGIDHSLPVED